MIAAPAAVSFLCSIFLAIFILVRRVRENVAKLALVAWLLGCNMVHGINASLWSTNVDLKALVWCDLVTKFVLATTIAVPAAFLCISRYLELVSSSRNLPTTVKAYRNRRITDAIICYLIPFLYMPLHIIAQDHRFDLVKGIGCVASVQASAAAAAVVWLPQILMCIFSLALSGMAVHNCFRHPSTHFSTHLESRSSMTSSVWSRTLAISMTVTTTTMIVLLFSLFSLPMSDSWISWQHVHQYLSQVNIVEASDQIAGLETFWWGLRAITLCYIVLVLIFGEESRDIFKYLINVKKRSVKNRPFVTLCSRRKDKEPSSLPPSFDTFDSRPPRPCTLELKSGWDDDLNIKSAGLSRLSPKSWKKGRASPGPQCPSPCPSSKTIDDGYAASSMSYLSSTMGNPLGYNTPVVPPPPVYQKARKNNRSYTDYDVTQDEYLSPTSPSSSTRPLSVQKKHRVTGSTASNIISVLQEAWPIHSPIPSDMTVATLEEEDEMVSPTRASSPALSIDERRQPCSYVASSSPHASHPFDTACGRPSSPTPPPALALTRSIKRSLTRRPSLSSIRSILGKERAPHAGNDVIHMTVVQETA